MKSALHRLKVPLSVFLIFAFAEICLFRAGLFWTLPYKNSQNSSHEREKLELMRTLDFPPEIAVFGSSWAEYGVDAEELSRSSGLRAANFSVISTQIFEHALFFDEVVKHFGKVPRYTLLVLDHTHIPFRKTLNSTRTLLNGPELWAEREASRDYLELVLRESIGLIKYKDDIELAIRGFMSPGNSHYFPTQGSIRSQNIEVWNQEKRWEKEEAVKMDRTFEPDEIRAFISELKHRFSGTQLIVVRGPVAAEVRTNFEELFSEEVRAAPGIQFLDYRPSLRLERKAHFYDKDHLNPTGSKLFSNWIGNRLLRLHAI